MWNYRKQFILKALKILVLFADQKTTLKLIVQLLCSELKAMLIYIGIVLNYYPRFRAFMPENRTYYNAVTI